MKAGQVRIGTPLAQRHDVPGNDRPRVALEAHRDVQGVSRSPTHERVRDVAGAPRLDAIGGDRPSHLITLCYSETGAAVQLELVWIVHWRGARHRQRVVGPVASDVDRLATQAAVVPARERLTH